MKSFLNLFQRPQALKPPAPNRRLRVDLGPVDPPYGLYVIGDVHGCMTELLSAEERIRQDIRRVGRSGLVITLGDYVDRGPQSSAVLEHLSNDRSARRLTLCGNHDDAFLNFLKAPQNAQQWLDFGGRETLLSYGVDVDYIMRKGGGRAALANIVERAIPQHHIRFLERLPVAARIGSFFFAHAGVRPGVALEDQSDNDLMWIREPFLTVPTGLPVTVVHGHTISLLPTFAPGRIGIDTGAYATGNLSVLRVVQGRVALI